MKHNIIYLMGAGRSGTTALATFLGNSKDILTLGEMHQFFEHIEGSKACSCGKELNNCPLWSEVLRSLPKEFIDNSKEYKEFCKKFEYHSSISKYMLERFENKELKEYREINETIFDVLKKNNSEKYFLDSAKYIGRVLGLRKSKKLNIKIIYVIRDVRGVISSFSKSVQSPRKPFNTIIYWSIINIIGEFLYRISPKNTILKVTYESLIEHPIEEFSKIENFLTIDLNDVKEKIKQKNSFDMPHIIGGNRLKDNKKIYFQKDITWREKYSKIKQIFYYLMASPIMIINRFKI